jgi:hypothetical protein
LIVTGAPGTAAPVGSLTRPEIEAVAACPYTLTVPAKNGMQNTKAMYRTSRFRELLIECLPLLYPLGNWIPPSASFSVVNFIIS